MHSARQAASFRVRAGYVGGRHKGLAPCLSTWQNTKQAQPTSVSECVEGNLESDQKGYYLLAEELRVIYPSFLLSSPAPQHRGCTEKG